MMTLQAITEQFVQESLEKIDDVQQRLLQVEQALTFATTIDLASFINSVFREIHTIKGNSRYLNLAEISEVSHRIEDVLDLYRKQLSLLDSSAVNVIIDATRVLKKLIGAVGSSQVISVKEIFNELDKLSKPRETGISKSSKVLPADDMFLDVAQQKLCALTQSIEQLAVLPSEALEKQCKIIISHLKKLAHAANYANKLATVKETDSLREIVEKVNLQNPVESWISSWKSALQQIKATVEVVPAVLPIKNSEEIISLVVPSKNGEQEDLTSEKKKSIRVDELRINQLMEVVGEIILQQNVLQHWVELTENEQSENVSSGSNTLQELKRTSHMMQKLCGRLAEITNQFRLVPTGLLFQRFPLIVRDMCIELRKDVELKILGGETEIDMSIVESLTDPLMHLIRNAVDHGIETPSERLRLKKTPKGALTLNAYQVNNQIVLEVSDDGKGLDLDKLKAKAIEKKIITKEVADILQPEDIYKFIFLPDFTTTSSISRFSGRGVGLDVVHTNVVKQRGTISVHSEMGKGTRFKLVFPLTMAAIGGLLVRSDLLTFAIPTDCVKEIVRVPRKKIQYLQKKEAIYWHDTTVYIYHLSSILKLTSVDSPFSYSGNHIHEIVIIEREHSNIGIVVDEVINKQDLVIKPLAKFLSDLQGISGSSILGNGQIVLVLEPNTLIAH